MKKNFLFYFVIVSLIFSLQSCVSNYVVSNNTPYKSNTDYKTIKTKTVASEQDEESGRILASMAAASQGMKNLAIENVIIYAKTIDDLLAEAETYLGTPYRYGGNSRSGIDCSAFVLSVFGATTGLELPRVAAEQSEAGIEVDKTELQKGDLVFFSHRGRRISHVGIVENVTPEGEVRFIHSATSKGVMISSLDDKYWGPRYKFAKRVIVPSQL